jgi:hypothetical protein
MAILETAAASLVGLISKSAGDGIVAKMAAIRNRKTLDEMSNSYEAIINELVQDRAEAIAVAQAYKSEVDRIEISDQDIEHLNKTIERLIELFSDKTTSEDIKIANQVKSLISVDTLKAIQLLGFNYKEALGEPLTRVCAEAIENKLGSSSSQQRNRSNQQVNSSKRRTR